MRDSKQKREWSTEDKADLEAAKREFDLLGLIQRDTGEAGTESKTSKGEPVLYFSKCPICGHNDCFRYYPAQDKWHCYGGTCAKQGKDNDGGCIEYLMHAHNMDQAEAIRRIRDETGHPLKKGAAAEEGDAACEFVEATIYNAPFDAAADADFDMTAKGDRIKATMLNFKRAIENETILQGRIRKNITTGELSAVLPLPWADGPDGTPAQWEDDWTLKAIEYVAKAYGFETDAKKAEQALKIVGYDNGFDPVIEHLENLPEWDGQRHAENLLTDFLGAEQSEYVKAVSRLFIYAIIERQYNPGAKFDSMLVLFGPQGLGKSTFCRRLALKNDFFTDQMQKFDSSEKDELQKLAGHVVVEDKELNGLHNAKTPEIAKGFIDARTDDFRAPYAKSILVHPRRFVLIGTTNKHAFLDDETGGRRFLPVVCGKSKPTRDLFNENDLREFEQAYAEAIYSRREHGALPLELTPEMKAAAAEAQQMAKMDDPEEEMLRKWIEDWKKPGDLICSRMAAEHGLELQSNSAHLKQKARRCADLLNAMPDLVERMEKKQRINGFGSAVTAWRKL